MTDDQFHDLVARWACARGMTGTDAIIQLSGRPAFLKAKERAHEGGSDRVVEQMLDQAFSEQAESDKIKLKRR